MLRPRSVKSCKTRSIEPDAAVPSKCLWSVKVVPIFCDPLGPCLSLKGGIRDVFTQVRYRFY